MKPIINEHGVITNRETKNIVDCKDGKIKIYHIEHNGECYATMTINTYNMGMSGPLTLDDQVESIENYIVSQQSYVKKYLSGSDKRHLTVLNLFEKHCNSLKQPVLF